MIFPARLLIVIEDRGNIARLYEKQLLDARLCVLAEFTFVFLASYSAAVTTLNNTAVFDVGPAVRFHDGLQGIQDLNIFKKP